MNIIFLGTPDFAVLSLEALIKSRHKVVAVVSQPDREKNRKGQLLETPVKIFAKQNNLPVMQFEKISENIKELEKIDADIMVTCAYGQILTQKILDLKKYGVINIHASILPKYRGAAPVQWALINGETETGITIMQTEKGLDSGDILYSLKTKIDKEENSDELFKRLGVLGAEAVLTALDMIENGKIIRIPQNNNDATYFPMLKKTDGKIDFNKPAFQINNLIRGVYSWPGAYTYLNGQLFKIYKAEVVENLSANKDCGKIIVSDLNEGLVVLCKTGKLKILTVQTAGGNKMPVKDFLLGNKIPTGIFLGNN